MERRFVRDVAALRRVFEFVDEFLDAEQVGSEHRYATHFVVEELFTNMVKYNRGNPREIAVGLDRNGDRLSIAVTDFDVGPFDPDQLEPVAVNKPLAERKPGGLGLHLIRTMVESLESSYEDRRCTITAIRRLEDTRA